MTSIGTGDSAAAISEKEMEILGPVLQEKEKAEFYLRSTDLDWTIVRPGGLLKDVSGGGGYRECQHGDVQNLVTARALLRG